MNPIISRTLRTWIANSSRPSRNVRYLPVRWSALCTTLSAGSRFGTPTCGVLSLRFGGLLLALSEAFSVRSIVEVDMNTLSLSSATQTGDQTRHWARHTLSGVIPGPFSGTPAQRLHLVRSRQHVGRCCYTPSIGRQVASIRNYKNGMRKSTESIQPCERFPNLDAGARLPPLKRSTR